MFALLWLAGGMGYVFPFTVDDAYIVARYAENWVDGLGYGLNPGLPTDGVTGPLWLAPACAARGLGFTTIGALKMMGGLCWIGAFITVISAMRRRFDGGASALAACAFAFPVSGIIWSVAGLETGAATLAVALLVRGLVLRAPHKRRSRLPGKEAWLEAVAVLSLPWLRPELVLPVAILCFGFQRRRAWSLVALLVISVGATALVRFAAFGHPLPLSFVAKGGSLNAGVNYALSGVLWLTAGGGAFAAVFARRRGSRPLGVACLVHLAAVAVVGGDWMPGHRLLVPLLPAYAVLAGWGGARLAVARPRARWLALPLSLAACLMAVAALPAAREGGMTRQRRAESLVEALAGEGPIGLIDVGFVGWKTRREVVDLAGITDPHIARMPGGHVDRRLDVAYLDQRGPTHFLLHSTVEPQIRDGELAAFAGYPTENRLIRQPWFRSNFRPAQVLPYAPGYWYVTFERR